MFKISGYERFNEFRLIEKGWSSDKKYIGKAKTGENIFLKVSDILEYSTKKAEFEAIERISQLGIPMMMPLQFGTLDSDGLVYMVFSWIDGTEAEIIMPELTIADRKKLGYESGVILKKIHSIKAPSVQQDWAERFNSKIDRNIIKYRSCGIKVPMENRIINYINDTKDYLKGRPQTIQHGDYHVGNIFITPDKKLSIIDFNRWDYGDPWEEFNRIVWTVHSSEIFASAQLDGYFGGAIPDEFFRLMALYIASNALASIPWAMPFGESDVNAMLRNVDEMLVYYENFNTYIPKWYIKY